MKRAVFFLFALSVLLCAGVEAPAQVKISNKPMVIPGELVIKFKDEVSTSAAETYLQSAGVVEVTSAPHARFVRGRIAPGRDFDQVLAQCRAQSNVEYVEPNYRLYALEAPPVFPNDPRFGDLWNLHQSNDNDIDAPEAWDLTTGNDSVVVAIIDTGVDYDHEDLSANIWFNAGESGGNANNGRDDDNNGYVDDVRGWNFVGRNNNPDDDNDHGTHVAGTVGAVGNNAKGVVGVNWRVKLMALKFLGRDGSGSTADAASAIIYAADNGAKILSNSWGGGGESQALKDAITYAHNRGALFIAAAGNESSNTDASPNFPSNYDVPNVISVASNDRNDQLSSFSNYGRRTVDLSAPGSSILSTRPSNGYQVLSGTSMATPHVSGVAALIWARHRNLQPHQVIIRLLGSVDRKSQFSGRMTTGGRLNAANALTMTLLIANTTDWGFTSNTAGPYPVSTWVYGENGVSRVQLVYSLNGAASDTLNMTAGARDTYSAGIPGQPLNTTINYFVLATDTRGTRAQSPTYSFRITTEPDPGNGGCCGQAAMSFEGMEGPAKFVVETPLNLAFFLLPLVLLRRRKKR